MFPNAPYIARPGNINAWDNEDFVKAVKATGQEAADHRRHRDRSLRGVSGPFRTRGGLRGLRRHRRLGHLQQDHPPRRLGSHGRPPACS